MESIRCVRFNENLPFLYKALEKYLDYDYIIIFDNRVELPYEYDIKKYVECNRYNWDLRSTFYVYYAIFVMKDGTVALTLLPDKHAAKFRTVESCSTEVLDSLIQASATKIQFKKNTQVWSMINDFISNCCDTIKITKINKERNEMAKIIQKRWRIANSNPEFALCRKRLLREFEEFTII